MTRSSVVVLEERFVGSGDHFWPNFVRRVSALGNLVLPVKCICHNNHRGGGVSLATAAC